MPSRNAVAAAAGPVNVTGGNLVLVIIAGAIALLALGVAFRAGPRGAGRQQGHREDAGDRPGGAGGRGRLPPASVQDDRLFCPADLFYPSGASRGRHCRALGPERLLPGGCPVLRSHRFYGHVADGARQRPRRRGGPRGRPEPRDADRLPHRRGGRHVHRRPGPARCDHRGAHLPGPRPAGAGGLRFRGRAARDVHASRRRHLHQGGRRRCGPGRQGGAGHPRGRPAERRDDRRQRRGQCGRLRGHGRRPVRVLRGHARGLADPRRGRVRRLWARYPAVHPGHRHHHRGHRHLRGPAAGRRPQRDERHQPGLLRLGDHLRDRRGDLLLHLPAQQIQRAHRGHRPRHPASWQQPAVDRVRRGR